MGFRWPTMPGSGRAQVAQQVGAIGAGIGRLGEVFEEKQARVRLDDFKLSVTKSMIELSNEIDKEQDEDKYQAMMDSAFSDLQGQIPKGMAGPLATSYLKSEKAAQLKSVDVSMELRVKSRWAAGLLVTETEAIESLNPIPFFDSVDTGVANGYILEDKAAKLKQGIVPRIKEAADLAQAETVRRHAKTLETADEALDYIDAHAPQKYKAGMATAERADRAREKSKTEERYKAHLEGVSDEMLERIDDPDYDIIAALASVKKKDRSSLLSEYKALSTATVPEESDFDAVDKVRAATDAFATGSMVTVDGKTFQADKAYARKVLKDNFKDLDSGDRTSLRDKMYAKQDKTHGQYRADARYWLKNSLLSEITALGRTFKAGTAEKRQYEAASIEMENKLTAMQKAGKFLSTQEWYAETQVIINKVKDPGYELGGADPNIAREQFILEGGMSLSTINAATPDEGQEVQRQERFPGIAPRRIETVQPTEEQKKVLSEERAKAVKENTREKRDEEFRLGILGRNRKLRRGPVRGVVFKRNAQGQVEIVNDVQGPTGFEFGLRRENGTVFEIGFLAQHLNGTIWEYQGRNKWVEVKKVRGKWALVE